MERLFAFAYLAGIAWLAGWEAVALAIRRSYTLSHIWWQVEGSGWTAARYLAVAVLGFLLLHLAFGWFR